MVARFLAPDLTQLSPAALIEEIDAEAILAAQKAFILARWDEVRQTRPDLPALDTLGLETEPMTILLEAFAYRETLLRALVNDKARAVLLAYATGSDLEHLGALFATYRMAMVPASDGVEAVMETDDRFRRRIQLAPEAFSCAGPRGAYIYFALTLDSSIIDAHAFCPSDGRVDVMVAAADGGEVSDDVIAALVERFHRDDTVPLTDVITVRRAEVVPYSVSLTLGFPRGPDPVLIQSAAEAAVRAYAAERYRINTTVFRAGLTAAAKVGGVENVIVTSPAADIVCGDSQIPLMTDVQFTVAVSNE
jgi:phage-related baseplate assembly protein